MPSKDDISPFPSRFNQDFDYAAPLPTAQDRAAFQAAKEQAASVTRTGRPRLHFKFDHSLTGKELAAALKQSLADHGIDPGSVMVRQFTKMRLQFAMNTGTDRDYSANVGYHGAVDGEREWMRGLGIYSKANVTFASPLSGYLSGGVDAPKTHDIAYVIYDKSQMYKVNPNVSNGFHTFLTSPQAARVGFMSENGVLELAKPEIIKKAFTVRPIGESDEDAVRGLLGGDTSKLDIGDSRHPANQTVALIMASRETDPKGMGWVAICDDKTVGIITTKDFSGGVNVDKEYRRMGIAEALIGAREDFQQKHGATEASAHIQAKNTASIRLHEKLGYSANVDVTKVPGETVVTFTKSFAAPATVVPAAAPAVKKYSES